MGTVPLSIGTQFFVKRNGHPPRVANILNIRSSNAGNQEAYISFVGQDKRLDEWVPVSELGDPITDPSADDAAHPNKHKSVNEIKGGTSERGTSQGPEAAGRHAPSPSVESSPEREHAELTRLRNYEDVRFGEYLVKTWYYSPYPLPHTEPHPHSKPQEVVPSSSSRKRKLPDSHGNSYQASNISHLLDNTSPNGALDGHAHVSMSQMSKVVRDRFVGDKGAEGGKRRLWVCDLCFKYMRTRGAWDRHSSICAQLQPPGRRVYQRGSYTIWEVNGAVAPLYCQNLSLFGKLFIDHKTIFFHVENFLFYIICDAATSCRDQAMAFFSKEKVSYDDYNLACIVAFPPFQNRGFGKLLIEFSYYLTKHSSTRPKSLSPGTPERPLSDLGLKGYMAYWVSVVLRLFRLLLKSAEVAKQCDLPQKSARRSQSPVKSASGRTLRDRSQIYEKAERTVIAGIEVTKYPVSGHPGHLNISLTLSGIAKACHLRIDDTALTLSELGYLQHRCPASNVITLKKESAIFGDNQEAMTRVEDEDLGDWKDVEVVVSREMIDEAWLKWNVKEHGVLDEKYVLL